jgi:hypothetical protein
MDNIPDTVILANRTAQAAQKIKLGLRGEPGTAAGAAEEHRRKGAEIEPSAQPPAAVVQSLGNHQFSEHPKAAAKKGWFWLFPGMPFPALRHRPGPPEFSGCSEKGAACRG